MSACANPPPAHSAPVVLCTSDIASFACEKARVRCPNEIADRFRIATVTFNVVPRFDLIPRFFNDANPPTDVIQQLRTIPMTFDGFFVKDGYIVGTSAWLKYLYLASVNLNSALACGEESEFTQNYPDQYSKFFSTIFQANACVDGASASPSFTDLFDILVQVYEVNRCAGQNYVYRAFMVGFDPNTGVAVYKIMQNDPWNRCLPEIKYTGYLELAQSVEYGPGNPAHVLGRWLGVAPMSFASGVITDNSVVDQKGRIGYEGIATTIPAGLGIAGAPILNQCAQVIGIATGLSQQGTVFGVSSNFANPIICEIIRSFKSLRCNGSLPYSQVFGTIMYERASLDVKYTVLTGNEIGLYQSDTILDTDFDPVRGNYLACSTRRRCHSNRRLVGLFVTDVCGCLLDAYTEEDCADDINIITANPVQCAIVRHRIEAGDIITHVNGMELGQLPGQYSLDQALYRLCCGDEVAVTFLKASEDYSIVRQVCVTLGSSLSWVRDISQLVGVPRTDAYFPNLFKYMFNALPDVEKSEIQGMLAYASLAYTNGFFPYYATPATVSNSVYAQSLLRSAYALGGVSYSGAVEYAMDINGQQFTPEPCATIGEVLPNYLLSRCFLYDLM